MDNTFQADPVTENKYSPATEESSPVTEDRYFSAREESSTAPRDIHASLGEKSSTAFSLKNIFQKLIRFISFVDLPIWKKFMLFSFGVLFWFIVMFAVSVAINIHINDKTHKIVNHIVPVDRATQNIIRKFQKLSVDITEIRNLSDMNLIHAQINASTLRIKDILSFVTTLRLGGQIADIDRETNRLTENFAVPPITVIPQANAFMDDIQSLIESLEKKIREISEIKINMINDTSDYNDELSKSVNDFEQLLSQSMALSNEFALKLSRLYTMHSGQINFASKVTLYIFTAVLFIASTLLFIFTTTISKSIAIPVKAIIEQIKSIAAGKIDLSKKIAIRSKDEVGILTQDFNKLTREIYDIVTFKKVIEEDDSLEDVYRRLGKSFREKCGLDKFIIYEVDSSKDKMKAVFPIILNEKEIFCNTEILDNCELCKVKKTGHEISSMSYNEVCMQFKPDLDKIHLCVPMIVGGKTGGVVQFLFDSTIDTGEITKKLFKAEQYIKESLSVIEAKRLMNTLRESALKDPLTGLYNRRFLQEYTETLVGGVLRRKKAVGLIMCDLDFFKQVNDYYGHNVGDSVLKETADIIKRCVRSADLVIRFGGEEFLLILLDINEGYSARIAEKIRQTVEKSKLKIPEGSIQKTISLGISEFPVDTESLWQAIKFADVALYKAKEDGRNRVVRFKREMWSEKSF